VGDPRRYTETPAKIPEGVRPRPRVAGGGGVNPPTGLQRLTSDLDQRPASTDEVIPPLPASGLTAGKPFAASPRRVSSRWCPQPAVPGGWPAFSGMAKIREAKTACGYSFIWPGSFLGL